MGNSKKIKVLGFDGWTMGARHYSRLLGAFKDDGIEMLLVHLGSWGDEKNRPREELIDGLLVRDISYYKDQSFSALLDLEQPDAVLFLSTETFLHRAFQRYCFKKGIPTIHLLHGLLGVVPVVPGKQAFDINIAAHISYAIERSRKFLRRTFLVYAMSLIQTRAGLKEWVRFFQEIYYRAIGQLVVVPAPDSRATRCCVYTKADLAVILTKWDYPNGEAIAVGNPDLISFGVTDDLIGIKLKRVSSISEKGIVYIDTGLSSHGYYFKSDEEDVNFIIDCANSVKSLGYKLYVKVKPHPATRHKFITGQLAKSGVEVLENASFAEVMSAAKACIIEPSTLGLIPCLMGLPVFLVGVGPLSPLRYGELFTGYPRATHLTAWADISRYLEVELTLADIKSTEAWIIDNTGPMPVSDMPKRVSSVVLELATKNAQG